MGREGRQADRWKDNASSLLPEDSTSNDLLLNETVLLPFWKIPTITNRKFHEDYSCKCC